ncbi:hypothetical protein MVES1_003320 [Malassezia vespertilionis]|uniref:uncharacterized protein n=1 Tax=Malassezia vespertilionis TaxID=2020962 RepID=UPI0024B0BFB5|nr:uncharacterized protein MVES1_003320 [Malassezia vespertilionis]WFD07951.1 hypothetical protein MVES1_003320 [Malassezia vespertilionis]
MAWEDKKTQEEFHLTHRPTDYLPELAPWDETQSPEGTEVKDEETNIESKSHRSSLEEEQGQSMGIDGKEHPKEVNPLLVTWDENDAHENPRAWKSSYRMFLVFVVSCYTFLSPLSSTANVPALDVLKREFNVDSFVIGNMMMSASMLAFVVGPSFYAPLSERYGRKYILQVANVLFLIFNVCCGLAKNSSTMIVLRFFAGLAGVAPVTIGPGVVADLFEPEERGTAMSMYTLSPILGPCVGPIYAGWIIQAYGEDKWPWIFWASTMFSGVVTVFGLFVLKETYTPVLLERKAKKLRKETGNDGYHTIFTQKETLGQRVLHGLLRPPIFYFTQPVIFVVCTYQALMFGCQYLLLASFSRVFKEEYGEPPGIASLHYIAMVLGFLVAGQAGGRWTDWNYRRLKAKNGGVGKPEFKLPLLIATGIFMPAGLLLYGWTVEYHIHWIVPDIGIFILACGARATMFISPLYLADSVTIYAASASGAAVMMRGVFSFTFPLFAPNMYGALGQGWGNSVLALVTACLGLPAPFILYKYGERLRLRSSYSKRGMTLMT